MQRESPSYPLEPCLQYNNTMDILKSVDLILLEGKTMIINFNLHWRVTYHLPKKEEKYLSISAIKPRLYLKDCLCQDAVFWHLWSPVSTMPLQRVQKQHVLRK